MSQLRDDVGSRRRRAPWWWPLALLGVTAAVILSLGGAEGGFTAKIANAGDRVETGSLVTAAASGASTECDLSTATYSPITQSSNTATCGGTLAPSGTLASGTTTSATVTTISEKGSLASSAGITEGVCGPVQLANTTAAARIRCSSTRHDGQLRPGRPDLVERVRRPRPVGHLGICRRRHLVHAGADSRELQRG